MHFGYLYIIIMRMFLGSIDGSMHEKAVDLLCKEYFEMFPCPWRSDKRLLFITKFFQQTSFLLLKDVILLCYPYHIDAL